MWHTLVKGKTGQKNQGCNEQVELYDRTGKAIKQTVRICKDSEFW